MTGKEFKHILLDERETLFDLYETGKISTNEFLTKIIERADLEPTEELFSKFDKAIRVFSNPDRRMLNLIKSLNSNVTLAILSNNWMALEETIRGLDGTKYEYLSLFGEHVYLSHRIGYKKPDKEAFQVVLDHIGIEPQNVLFVDDKERNTLIAEEMGMKGYIYTKEKFKEFEEYIFEYVSV